MVYYKESERGYRVHVFNPNSIHGAIEYEPISCWARINWHVPEGHRKNTIGPFMWHGVELTVKLSHSDWLWIQNIIPKINNPWIFNTCWKQFILFLKKKLQENYVYWREHELIQTKSTRPDFPEVQICLRGEPFIQRTN